MQLTKLHTGGARTGNQKGFTLIEIAIVLTIVGLIIGGIWLAASTVFNNDKTRRLSADAIQVIQNTKTLFAGQGGNANATGFNLVTAATSGIFPADMIAGTQAAPIIITPFNTNPTVNGVALVTTANTLTYTFGAGAQGLPSSACTQLLLTLGSSNNIEKLGITALSGDGTAVLPAAGASVTALAAGGACNNNAGNANTVLVTFSAV